MAVADVVYRLHHSAPGFLPRPIVLALSYRFGLGRCLRKLHLGVAIFSRNRLAELYTSLDEVTLRSLFLEVVRVLPDSRKTVVE